MNLYDTIELQKKIDHITKLNDGEIPEELMEELVAAEMRSVQKIENICKYIRHLELEVIRACKSEEDRISKIRQRAENIITSMKKYMTPYVKSQGKIEAGTFKLSTRKSEQVKTADDFKSPDYCDVITTYKPRKNDIKKAIKNGEKINGAWLEEIDNLQIK